MDSSDSSNNLHRITMRIAAMVSAILAASLLVAPMSATAQGPNLELVSDLNEQVSGGAYFEFPQKAQIVDGYFFFSADSDGQGQRFDNELWKSDGTVAGTAMVKDINLDSSSDPRNIVTVGNVIYFTANDGINGTELWKSDGTSAGTVMVKDINPSGSSDPSYLTAFSGNLYFSAQDTNGNNELWKSDGTAAGTVMVKDINPSGSSDPSYLTELNGNLYFSAQDFPGNVELWRTNGTAGGTFQVKDIKSGALGSSASELVVAGNKLFFRADDQIHGNELWMSDGTDLGTQMVIDIDTRTINGFPANSIPSNLTSLNGFVFFRADGPNRFGSTNYSQLWKSDGTTTTQLTEIDRSNGGSPSLLTVVGNELFFQVFQSNPSPLNDSQELWKSDGTRLGTGLVQKINQSGSSIPVHLTSVDNTLFFSADDGVSGSAVWKSDGNVTSLVRDVMPSATGFDELSLRNFFEFQGRLIFTVSFGRNNEHRLWTSDGTYAGTTLLININDTTDDSLGSDGLETFEFNGHLYFTADDGVTGYELWRLNLATGTLVQFADFETGIGDSYPYNFTRFGSSFIFVASPDSKGPQLRISNGDTSTVLKSFDEIDKGLVTGNTYFFSADDGTHGYELWRSDGTETGTVIVKDISVGSDSSPSNLFTLGNTLFFTADDGVHGRELWKSDGTEVGTVMVKDINAENQGADGSSPENFIAFGNTLFFTADDGVHGRELWKSDGSLTETVMVKDIAPNQWDEGPAQLLMFGDALYFTANDGTRGRELWRSDGTETGTVMVKDINSSYGSSPSNFIAVGSTLFFTADDGTRGYELWRSDGTETGTVIVKDISAGSGSSPSNFIAVGSTLFFTADDGVHGRELWRSDGTSSHTVMVGDINPQPSSDSSPRNLTPIGSLLYFVADNGSDGNELWFTSGDDVTLVSDLFPGVQGSNPSVIIDGGDSVYFAADNGRFGKEWWQIGLGTVAESNSPVTPAPSPSTPVTPSLPTGSGPSQSTPTPTASPTPSTPVTPSLPTGSGPSQSTPTPTASPTPSVTPTPSPKPSSTVIGRLSVSGFAGDSSRLNSRQLTLIRAGIATHRDVRQVVCTGFTSGRVATATARRLANARAVAVCRALAAQKPSVVTRIAVSPAKGSGAKFRRVDVQFIK